MLHFPRASSKALMTSTALTMIGALPGAAFAQEQLAQQTAQQMAGIEEIVVTGTRRSETIQEAPINISALATADIERMRLNNISDLARWVPGLSVVDQGSRAGSAVIVRGLSVSSTRASESLGNDNGGTVGVYIGEIPLYVDLKPYDMERVEFLVGPQGTLYGAGTLGGAIRYIPNKPDPNSTSFELHSNVYGMSHSDGEGFEGDLVANIPLAEDTLALRVVLGRISDPGFIDYDYLVKIPGVSNPEPDFTDPDDVAANLTRKKDVNDEETFSGRVGALWRPTDTLEATLWYYFQKQKSGGRQITSRAAFDTGNYVSAMRFVEPNDLKNHLVALELSWDLGFATLTSASGLSYYSEEGQRDQTDLLLDFEYGYESFPSFAAYTREEGTEERRNQELRLVSNSEGPLSWIVGGFYNYYNNYGTSSEFAPGIPDFFGIDRPDNLEYYSESDTTQKEKAAYGEVSYRPVERWQVTVGARYYDYSVDDTQGVFLPLFSDEPTAILPDFANVRIKDDGYTYKFNTSYDFTDDAMVYGTLSKGFRLGGANPVPPCPDPIPPGQNVCALPNEILIQPDTTLNKEIGVKSAWLDGRMIINAAVFHIDWKDIRVRSSTINGSQPIDVNGGKAVSKGIEFSGRALLTDEFSAAATWSYTDAYLTEDAPGLVDGVADGLDGDRVSGSPRHKASLTLDYMTELQNGMMFGANYGVSYQSNIYSKVGLRNSGEAIPGYTLHNASLTLSQDSWEVSLYADNIFDNFYTTAVRSHRPDIKLVGPFRQRSFYEDVGRPRVVGLEFRYRYGS